MRDCPSKIKLVVLVYQKAVCKQFWKSVWTRERFALGGYLICSLKSKRHNALNVAGNFWKHKSCISRLISNLLTGDETWVHMFEPQSRADNKQWKQKDQKRPCIAKRTTSSKKMYAVFFNSSGPVVQVPCPSGHTVTGELQSKRPQVKTAPSQKGPYLVKTAS